MRVNPGVYVADKTVVLNLMRGGSEGPWATCVNYRVVAAGETYEVPQTVNGFYYTVETMDQVEAEVSRWYPE